MADGKGREEGSDITDDTRKVPTDVAKMACAAPLRFSFCEIDTSPPSGLGHQNLKPPKGTVGDEELSPQEDQRRVALRRSEHEDFLRPIPRFSGKSRCS